MSDRSQLERTPEAAPLTHSPVQGNTYLPNHQQQQRAEQRRALAALRQGHATTGLCATFSAPLPGREACAPLTAKQREGIFGEVPAKAKHFNAVARALCTSEPQSGCDTQGNSWELTLKKATLEERLQLAFLGKRVKLAYRPLVMERALDLLFSPLGITKEQHAATREVLKLLTPRRLLALGQEEERKFFAQMALEDRCAWRDPRAAGLSCLDGSLPARPNAAYCKQSVQCWSERASHLNEYGRLLVGEIIKPFQLCLPSALGEYVARVNPMLELSSEQLYQALGELAQELSPDYAAVEMLAGQTLKANGQSAKEYLQTLVIVPKSKKRSSKRTSAMARKATARKPKQPSTSLEQLLAATEAAQPQSAAPSASVVDPADAPADAPSEAMDDPADAPSEAMDDPADAPSEAMDDQADAPSEALDDPADAPSEALDDPADVPSAALDDLADAPSAAVDDPADAPSEALDDPADATSEVDSDVPVFIPFDDDEPAAPRVAEAAGPGDVSAEVEATDTDDASEELPMVSQLEAMADWSAPAAAPTNPLGFAAPAVPQALSEGVVPATGQVPALGRLSKALPQALGSLVPNNLNLDLTQPHLGCAVPHLSLKSAQPQPKPQPQPKLKANPKSYLRLRKGRW
ncbi:MAG TPA: hypothetical protein H9898_07185 [Candidatus Anaerobiospirillum stercoravium]|nr:hypothetical protein [Candidatus Anaerobiospirillum stercoravium]